MRAVAVSKLNQEGDEQGLSLLKNLRVGARVRHELFRAKVFVEYIDLCIEIVRLFCESAPAGKLLNLSCAVLASIVFLLRLTL